MSKQKQMWYFTFGFGQVHQNCYTKFYGTQSEARDKMVNSFGTKWAFQYISAEEAGVERFNLKEIK